VTFAPGADWLLVDFPVWICRRDDPVDVEARHDWLDQLPDLKRDARPSPDEYEESDQ
jgi:hypothetical protein